MSIKELRQKIKGWWGMVVHRESNLFWGLMLFLVSIGGFGLGQLSYIFDQKKPVRVEWVDLGSLSSRTKQTASISLLTENKFKLGEAGQIRDTVSLKEDYRGRLVGSKNGTKYHRPDCSGAKRIKEENKVWFDSAEAAKAAGYTPAANCSGLQ